MASKITFIKVTPKTTRIERDGVRVGHIADRNGCFELTAAGDTLTPLAHEPNITSAKAAARRLFA